VRPARALDVAIIIDTTGTMATSVSALARSAEALAGELARHADVRLGVVAFKDHGAEGEDDTYLVRTLPLGWDPARAAAFLGSPALAPGAGGGGAEAVECALRAARGLAWREEARRIAVLVGDKPPHGAGLDGLDACPHGVDYRDEVEALAARDVALHAVQVGDHLVTRRVFEYLAARTGGAYVDLARVRDLPRAIAATCLDPALEASSPHDGRLEPRARRRRTPVAAHAG
jgi:hypothetical protein